MKASLPLQLGRSIRIASLKTAAVAGAVYGMRVDQAPCRNFLEKIRLCPGITEPPNGIDQGNRDYKEET